MKIMYEKEVFLVIFLTILALSFGENRPPAIVTQPPKDVYYKSGGERVELPCVANGTPPPLYRWKSYGIDYNPSGQDGRVVQLPNAGTIVINRPEDKDEGIFQCFADNGYGVSASIKINLRQAKLEPFTRMDRQAHSVQAGDYLTLPCNPPMSMPYASIQWVLKELDGQLTAINYDKRVTMDIEGRLRFTNVIFADEQNGKAYACMANNSFLRDHEVGREHTITVMGTTEQMRPAYELWTSPSDLMALKGEKLRLKCIFAGNPTPDVYWEKIRGTLPDRAQFKSFGQELEITNIQYSDVGQYECRGLNSAIAVRQNSAFNVRVVAAPYWTEEPVDSERGVGEKATFLCLADGDPSPLYMWFINGIPISDSTDTRVIGNTRAVMQTNNFTLSDLTLADHMNIQCNASNIHGYVFADVFLNVLDIGDIFG